MDLDAKINKYKRYYVLHRDEVNAQRLERYHNHPEVIAKKEEREKKKAAKAAENELKKQAKLLEKIIKHEEEIKEILASKNKVHPDEEKISIISQM